MILLIKKRQSVQKIISVYSIDNELWIWWTFTISKKIFFIQVCIVTRYIFNIPKINSHPFKRTRSSALSFSNDRRKRKRASEIDKPCDRTNKSHTAYFFAKMLKTMKLLTVFFVNENLELIKNHILKTCQFIYETNMA